MAADLVIKNGWVVTPEETFKGGVAISNEKFVAIGADDQLPQGKEEIDAARQPQSVVESLLLLTCRIPCLRRQTPSKSRSSNNWESKSP